VKHHRIHTYKSIQRFNSHMRMHDGLFVFVNRPATRSICSTVEEMMHLGHDADDIPHVTVNAPDDFR
jgi:hypothetical protein